MARKNRRNQISISATANESLGAAGIDYPSPDIARFSWWSRLGGGQRLAAIGVVLLLTLGAAGAGLKYLDESAKRERTASVGKSNFERSEPSLLSKVNPFAAPPMPSPTPQLSKEYIYAGSRMLAVEDAGASAAPPADVAVWRPSTGYWYVMGGTGSQQTFFQWGTGGSSPTDSDKPAPGDYDGDGKTDFSVFRPSNGTWYVVRSSDGTNFAYQFGQSGDQVAPADFDGDGRTDTAVFRAGNWYIQRSSDSVFVAQQFGLSSDVPTPADFDGDGRADLAVRRDDGHFYIRQSATGTLRDIHFGNPSDVPVIGDYDGDGKADAAIWCGAPDFQWHALLSGSQTIKSTTLGDPASDIAVPNDYDADGKTDMAVWRRSNGTWYIQKSSAGAVSIQWGQNGDVPVPAFYRR